MSLSWIQLVIIVLASYRLTRLIIEDTILEPIRVRTVFKLDPQGWLRTLLDCAWCTGMWLSLLLVCVFYLWSGAVWLYLPFAVSTAVGLIATHE